jgi:hypothetical protein
MSTLRVSAVQSVPVKEIHNGQTVWEGVVHVFDLAGHSKATRAYAWSSPIEGSDKRRFFAVLHMGAIDRDPCRLTLGRAIRNSPADSTVSRWPGSRRTQRFQA